MGLCIFVKENLKLTFKVGDETVELFFYRNKRSKMKLNIFAKEQVTVIKGTNDTRRPNQTDSDDNFGNK